MTTNARIIDVASAAVTLLNSATAQAGFVLPFVAVRDYVPLYDLESQVAGLLVTVMPAILEERKFARLTIGGEAGIDVAIQDYVPPADPVAALALKDKLMLLVEQVKTVLEKGLILPEANLDCGWLRHENDPIYEPDHMLDFHVFTSVPRVIYQVRRTR